MKITLIVAGSAMVGFWVPEIIGAFTKVKIPLAANWWMAAAFALIAAGLLL